MIKTYTKLSSLQLLLFAWAFISLFGALETFMIYLFRPETIQSPKFYWLPLMRLVNGVAAILLVLYPGYYFFRNKRTLIKLLGYGLMMILFVLVYLIFSVGQFQLAFLEANFQLFIAGIGETLMTDLHHIVAYYFFLLFICLLIDYFEDRSAAQHKREQVELELSKAKLMVLQQQIQPHFLFNTLNNVVAIIDERKDYAQEMLVDLSELLRISMRTDFAQGISLRDELEILALYIAIEQKRYEHQLQFAQHLAEDLLDKVQVPPFLFQPLVENAIKHGFKAGIKHLKIEILIAQELDQVQIEIKNNGAPYKPSKEGIGLKNVSARLENYYGTTYDFQILQEGAWVVNKLKIPIT